MNFPLFIARRIYSNQDDSQRVSRPAIRIATAGVAIGLSVMIISICIVFGFKHSIRDKIIGFGGDITVANFISQHGNNQAPICIGDSILKELEGVPGVKHTQRYCLKQGILKTDTDFLGIMFKGLAPEYDTTFIHKNMLSGEIPAFSDTISQNKILISKIMADQLKLNTGDKVFAYFIDQGEVRTRRFLIAGVYQTNLTQYDKMICFTDLYTAVRLNGWVEEQVSGAEIIVKDFDKVDQVENLIVKKVNHTQDKFGQAYSSETIQDSNPQIFAWLDLLDLNVWIILILMMAVASITMISGLLIIILERTSMIGLLKALGANNLMVRRTFLWFAVFIIGRGIILGDLIGLGLVILQNLTGIVTLDPTTYYVKTVPVEINIGLILLLNVATFLISVFVLIAPSFLISHIHPAKSMKYE